MKVFHAVLALGALTSALLVATPAYAATDYCDNDRSSVYPCYNLLSSGWWYAHWSGDKNGDDRRNSGGSGYNYGWVFNTYRTYSFYAWLANPYFTDTAAIYGYWNNGWVHVTNINQNTAPNGWSYVGTRYTNAMSVWRSNSTTGADMLRGDYVSTALAAPEVKLEQRVADRGVGAIQQKMLNAVDHFRDASGSFRIFFANNAQDDEVDFEVSNKDKSSFVRIRHNDGEVVEHATRGQSAIELHPAKSSYAMTRIAEPKPVSGPRAYRNEKGENVFVYRQDPTWAIGANEITLPQNYAFWLGGDSASRIVGHEKLLGRDAAVIQGRHDAYLADKLGAATFRMWVDDATGVLLKLVGSDQANRTVYFIDVKAISFDTGLDLRPTIKAPAGWKNVRPSAR